MAPVKKEPKEPEMAGFLARRQQNIVANAPFLNVITNSADGIAEPKNERGRPPAGTKKKKAAPRVKTEAPPTRATRSSLRLAGDDKDGEVAKRKAEFDAEQEVLQVKAKRLRVAGDLSLGDLIGDDKKSSSTGLVAGLVRGAEPYVRTFTQEDIKETTDETLKSLRETMSALELYPDFEVNEIKITPERIYSMGFHPSPEKTIIFAGDKLGTMGIFDASQSAALVKTEGDNSEDDEDERGKPVITQLKLHTRTITSFVFPPDGKGVYTSSYDSSIRKFDFEKEVAVEIFAPASADEDMPVSCMAIPSTDPNTIWFTTLEGQLCKKDMRSPNFDIYQIRDKKIGGFSLHPLHPHLAATASNDRMFQIWDLRNIKGRGDDRVPALIGEHESKLSVSHASWSAAGHVATSSYDDTVKIYSFLNAGSFKVGHDLTDKEMKPTSRIPHNNQVGRWVTILKPQWQERPDDGIQKFVIGNMNRFVDVFDSNGEQLAQLSGNGITAVPAVAQFHPTKNWVAAGTASGKLCLWM